MFDTLSRLGWEPLDLVNFPGRLAAAVFVQGCPLRCPYCHNPRLTGPLPKPGFPWDPGMIPRDQVLDHLERRRGTLTGLVIGGGEPTMHPGLPDLVEEAGSLGYGVKVDTCGYYPEHLGKALEKKALVALGLDLKTDPKHYSRLGPLDGGTRLTETLELLGPWLAADPARRVDLRTTLSPGITQPEDLTALEALASGISQQAGKGQVRYLQRPAVPQHRTSLRGLE